VQRRGSNIKWLNSKGINITVARSTKCHVPNCYLSCPLCSSSSPIIATLLRSHLEQLKTGSAYVCHRFPLPRKLLSLGLGVQGVALHLFSHFFCWISATLKH
jgi:hypothetical protein